MDDMGADTESIPQIEDDELDRTPPKWPKVVGIISIVFGSLGLTCIGCSLTMMTVGGSFIEKMVQQAAQQSGGASAPTPPTMQFGAIDLTLGGIGVVLSVVLLLAGITTLSRKSVGRLLHLVYGGANLPLTLWSTWNTLQKMAAMGQYVRDNPDSPFAQGYSPIGSMIGIAFGLAIGLAYPVFCLVWFGAVKTRHEQMTGGLIEPAA